MCWNMCIYVYECIVTYLLKSVYYVYIKHFEDCMWINADCITQRVCMHAFVHIKQV